MKTITGDSPGPTFFDGGAVLERPVGEHGVTDAAPGESDASLVERSRRGDPDAFEALFLRHHGRVLRVATRILRDRESALDAVQETFVRAYRSLDRYSGEGSFGGWLIRITANLAVDGVRRRRRVSLVETTPESWDTVETAAGDDGPDHHAESRELRQALESALARLAPMQRVVLVLKEIEGRSCEEIAQMLRCSVGTVMSRLHYGRAKLQRSLRRWPR
jgi:RNA polymerase sigma-70 factor (ECF subfamily)